MKFDLKVSAKICAVVFVFYLILTYWENAAKLIGNLFSAAFPVFLGCVLAYILNIPMSFYEKHYFKNKKSKLIIKSRRPVCLVAAIISLLAIVALVTGLIVPQLISCFKLIFAELPKTIDYIIENADNYKFIPQVIIDFLSTLDLKSKIGDIAKMLTSGVGNMMDVIVKAISSVFSGVVSTLLSIIFSVYLLVGKEKLKAHFDKLLHTYLKKKIYTKIEYVFSVLNNSFHNYIVGQCTEAVILGILCTIGMLILRLPYASMIGALIAFTALIPVAGAYIGAGVGAFMILTVSPVKALVFLIFLVVLQQLEGNIIYPKVVGSSIGLPGIWVLAAVTVGGGILGIGGMLLGVPVTAALYQIIRDDINKYPPA